MKNLKESGSTCHQLNGKSITSTHVTQTKMKLINRILNETTCEGETLDIYIKPAHDHDMPDWKKAGTHQYCVVFHFNNVGNPDYGHSYYIDTIMDPYWNNDEGLCLNGSRWEDFSDYESMDKKSMDNVRKFIQKFVDVNGLNLHKEERKK